MQSIVAAAGVKVLIVLPDRGEVLQNSSLQQIDYCSAENGSMLCQLVLHRLGTARK